MVQPPSLAALHELQHAPSSPADQLRLLRLIKNDIVGHGQRKELVVQSGLLEPLAGLMLAVADTAGKKPTHRVNGAANPRPVAAAAWSLDDDIRLQAVLIVASLANGGPAFINPILSVNILPTLLLSLVPADTPPALVVATLRALNSLASAWTASCSPVDQPDGLFFVDCLFTKSSIASFLSILQQPLSSDSVGQQIGLVASLISTCCLSDLTKSALVKSGILDALATLLASTAVSGAYDVPPSSVANPAHAPRPDISHVLNAISAIVDGSHYRTYRLICSPALWKVFSDTAHQPSYDPGSGPDFGHSRRPSDAVPVGHLLPKVMAPLAKQISFGSQSFPALSALNSSRIFAEQTSADASVSSPLCVWLIYLARSQPLASSRLAALRLLACVNDALDAEIGGSRTEVVTRSRERERQLALLAVPVAVKLVQDAADTERTRPQTEELITKEEACLVLARLIENSLELQKAAYEAGAVKHIAHIFRKSFDPVPLARPMWSPQNHIGQTETIPPPAGALEAVAAIAYKDDAIRKAIIESGIVPNIIESLTPFPVSAIPTGTTVPRAKDGNTVPVLLAACRCATAMSRSVSLLRTSLIDAGIAKPVFALLKHSDNAVQVAATNVTINLVLDFSPMRPDLVEAGIAQTLCEHARRSNPKLRQASLWALKHLVLNAPQAMKQGCLEELGTGWLIQAVSGESREASASSLGMSTPNAVGERVDLLNTPGIPEVDMDWMDREEDNEDDGEILYDYNGTRYQSSSLRSTLDPANHKARLRLLREHEQNPAIQARQDDMMIQEQALDFIRNLINGDDNVNMIEYLNSNIGPGRIYDMLYNKLKPVVLPAAPVHGLGGRPANLQSQSPQQGAIWQPPELINAALGVIIHLASGSPRHRQQLIAQKQLLTAWLPHFTHHDRRIRISSVWAVINLTWVDDARDRTEAARRALELREIGFYDKIVSLANDTDLDTRERVKTALRQMDELLDGSRHR
ncbi:hypothetical protein MBLNU459_g0401t1 [Dothideomycetes sp. NU459]